MDDYVVAGLNYLVHATARPRVYANEPPLGEARNSGAFEMHEMVITNARSHSGRLSLDEHGLKLVRHESSVRNFHDEHEMRRVYYAETAQLLAKETGASRVIVFDHTIRERLPTAISGIHRQPVMNVHVDYTIDSAPRRVRALMGDEAEELVRGRFAIINVWRPIRAPLRDSPLAVADASSIGIGQLVAADLIYPDRTGGIYYVTFSPSHRWFYVPSMRLDEVLIFRNYDSHTRCLGHVAAHCAFQDPTKWPVVEPRASVEARAVVLFGTTARDESYVAERGTFK